MDNEEVKEKEAPPSFEEWIDGEDASIAFQALETGLTRQALNLAFIAGDRKGCHEIIVAVREVLQKENQPPTTQYHDPS